MHRHFKITIKGKVQGVFFRAGVQGVARDLGLYGYVKNLLNGDVFAEVEGNEDALQKLLDWCHTGTKNSKVIDVIVEPASLIPYDNFQIKY